MAHTDAAAAPAWIDRRLPWLVIGCLGGRADGTMLGTDTAVEGSAPHVAAGDDIAGIRPGAGAPVAGVRPGTSACHVDAFGDPEESSVSVAVPEAERIELSFAVVLADRVRELPRLFRQFTSCDPATELVRWSSLVSLDLSSRPHDEPVDKPAGADAASVLPASTERETCLHAVQLVAARQHDDHFGTSYVSHGSAYGFVHGLQGAPRDYAISAVPLSFIDPPAARDLLVTCS
ncbi:MAG: hypothetical protein JJU45_18110 [Acidimicrobiia bacterium]|nr:hypothetical protein [Acidimicrobiia bacterium]